MRITLSNAPNLVTNQLCPYSFNSLRLTAMRNTEPRYSKATRKKASPSPPDTAKLSVPHKFDIEAMSPPMSAKTARSRFRPVLEDMGYVQPAVRICWHEGTALVFSDRRNGVVHKGRARMSIFDPGGYVETFELKP